MSGFDEDDDLKQLEDALRPLRYEPRRDELVAHLESRRPARPWRAWAVAAMLVLAAGLGAASYLLQRTPGWAIARTEGIVRLSPAARLTGRLRPGEQLETASGRAQLRVGSIGDVTIGPGSRIRLLENTPGRQALSLDYGDLKASILAPPRQFQVETPAARAVDLGCAYALRVDRAGNGHLEVTMGWVSFEIRGRQSFIPVGAACRTRRGLGPGTPYYLDADPALVAALDIVDFDPGAAARHEARLRLLPLARRRDALTLWHLLARGTLEERTRTLDRLTALAPLPDGVTRAALLALDPAALQRLWDGLQLGPASWWKLWGFTPPAAPLP